MIGRLGDRGDHEAWNEFERLYRPTILAMARRHGMQANDADDLCQIVWMSVAKSIEDFQPDRNRARFASWLRTIARNAIINALTRRDRVMATGGTDAHQALQQTPVNNDETDTAVRDYRRAVFDRAAEMVRDEVSTEAWQCFAWAAIDGMPASEIAKRLSRSIGSVYTARSRVMKRFREIVTQLESEP